MNLKNGYNGDLTSREAGNLGKARWSRSVGPYEVRSMSGRAGRRWGTSEGGVHSGGDNLKNKGAVSLAK